MANIFFAAVLLSGILAVSGCAGLVPALEALGAAGDGGYPIFGGAQSYPYEYGPGEGYAQEVQPYYESQPYAYSGNPEVYYQQVPQAPQSYYDATPSGRWMDRRQQHRQDRIYRGRAPGHLTHRKARRWHNEPGPRGPEHRMRAYGNLHPQARAHLNDLQTRRSQDSNRLGYNRVQPGPRVLPRPARPGRPMAEWRTATQPRAANQHRTSGGRGTRHDRSSP